MYVHVDDNGNVDRRSEQPPRSMRLKDGRSVSGQTTDSARLKMAGWVEATDDPPEYDPDFESLVGPIWRVTTEDYFNSDGDRQTYEVPVDAVAEYIIEDRPAHLAVDKNEITADNTDTATVTFRDRGSEAPTEVTFDVGGEPVGPVQLIDGAASTRVTTSRSGTITVGVDAPDVDDVVIRANRGANAGRVNFDDERVNIDDIVDQLDGVRSIADLKVQVNRLAGVVLDVVDRLESQ